MLMSDAGVRETDLFALVERLDMLKCARLDLLEESVLFKKDFTFSSNENENFTLNTVDWSGEHKQMRLV